MQKFFFVYIRIISKSCCFKWLFKKCDITIQRRENGWQEEIEKHAKLSRIVLGCFSHDNQAIYIPIGHIKGNFELTICVFYSVSLFNSDVLILLPLSAARWT